MARTQTDLIIHAGEFLRDALKNLDINQSVLARGIGVNPSVINEICNEKRSISAEMALKLGKYFEAHGLNSKFWINIQSKYDLDIAMSKISETVESIQPAEVDRVVA